MQDMDDEINEESSEFVKLKQRLLFNKRIWKYIIYFTILYISSRKVFDPWYIKPSNMDKLSKMDNDPLLLENIIGSNGHKPASNFVLLIDSIIHWIYTPQYAFMTIKERVSSLNTKTYQNKTNYILDIHIALWVFLTVIDVRNGIKTKKFTKADKLMIFHHITGGITSMILRHNNIGDKYWGWVAFWTESIGIGSLFGGLLRVIYQKKRNDLIYLRHISDILFGLSMFLFTYARVYLFMSPSMTKKWYKMMISNEINKNHPLIRMWCTFILSMNVVGGYWVIQTWRVITEKVLDLLQK